MGDVGWWSGDGCGGDVLVMQGWNRVFLLLCVISRREEGE